MGMSVLCTHVYVCKLNWEIEECDICVQLLLSSSRPSPLHFDPYFGVIVEELEFSLLIFIRLSHLIT